MTEEEMESEVITTEELVLQFINQLERLQWLASRALIANSRSCTNCHIAMSLVRRSTGIDGYEWRCKRCQRIRSVREKSFFYKSNLHLKQIITIVRCWSQDLPQVRIAEEAQLGNGFNTIIDWCNFCREVCEEDLIQKPDVIGGMDEETLESRIVEIDESKFFHRKYHRGRYREGVWLFGGVERDSRKCFMVEVPDRTEETLSAAIQRFILPGTIIVSDGWRGYTNIGNIGGGIYEHRFVVHERNFVDPQDTSVDTQNVENLWMHAKRKLRRQFGTSRALLPSYISEFLWKL